ncbi:hypothetical protein ND748_29565 [Frankia sp. AiPs1]|uniref:hypothetical protein n=1 Tax=Frankia sp. AiPs1 TaxID=573493 RepID=UPI002043848F|nr:hypothetical protein [Frankia sp. AiPs1]MCM3925808.1 hypothetical protein [Frankia sp. AiPs1]
MTSLSSLRPVQFLHSIHMRRSTIALVVFFLLTVALYLLVRPTPEHIVQDRRSAQTTQSTRTDGSDDSAVVSPARPRHATPRPTDPVTPTSTPTSTATGDPAATATPTTPSTLLSPTATADTGSGLRPDGSAATPGVTVPAPAATPGPGSSGTTPQP